MWWPGRVDNQAASSNFESALELGHFLVHAEHLGGLGEEIWTEGVESKPQKIAEVGFQIRTMKETAPKVGCVHAGRISSRLGSSHSDVQSGLGSCGPVTSGKDGLLLHQALASSLGRRFFPGTRRLSCILPRTPRNCWQLSAQLGASRNTTFIWYRNWYFFYIVVGTH